jgi:hypothetical protein
MHTNSDHHYASDWDQENTEPHVTTGRQAMKKGDASRNNVWGLLGIAGLLVAGVAVLSNIGKPQNLQKEAVGGTEANTELRMLVNGETQEDVSLTMGDVAVVTVAVSSPQGVTGVDGVLEWSGDNVLGLQGVRLTLPECSEIGGWAMTMTEQGCMLDEMIVQEANAAKRLEFNAIPESGMIEAGITPVVELIWEGREPGVAEVYWVSTPGATNDTNVVGDEAVDILKTLSPERMMVTVE